MNRGYDAPSTRPGSHTQPPEPHLNYRGKEGRCGSGKMEGTIGSGGAEQKQQMISTALASSTHYLDRKQKIPVRKNEDLLE